MIWTLSNLSLKRTAKLSSLNTGDCYYFAVDAVKGITLLIVPNGSNFQLFHINFFVSPELTHSLSIGMLF